MGITVKSKSPLTHVIFLPHDWNLAGYVKLTRASRTNWSGSKEDILLHGCHGFIAYTRMTIATCNIGRAHGPYQSIFITTETLLFNKESLDNLIFEITLYYKTGIKGGRSGGSCGVFTPTKPKRWVNSPTNGDNVPNHFATKQSLYCSHR